MKYFFTKIIFAIVALLLCSAMPSSARAADKTRTQNGKKITTINFEDQLIHGDIDKPELFYILQKKQFNFNKLIKMRENFLPEMKKTSEEIPRGIR